jgi:hypothetical protein
MSRKDRDQPRQQRTTMAQPVEIPGNVTRAYRATHRPNLMPAIIAAGYPGEAPAHMTTAIRSSPISRRRAALMTLGAGGLAVLAHPITTDARNKRKKKRNKGDVFKRCKKQVGQCLDFFLDLCEDDLECQAVIEVCCASLGTCDLNGLFVCIDDSNSSAARAARSAVIPEP